MQFFSGSDKHIILFFHLINVEISTIFDVLTLWAGKIACSAQLSSAWKKFYNIGTRPESSWCHVNSTMTIYFQLWSASFSRICNFLFQNLEYCPDCGFCITQGTDNVNMYHYINANGANINNSATVNNMDGKIILDLSVFFSFWLFCKSVILKLY